MLIIEMAKIEINRRPYWIYFIYIDYQNENGTLLGIETAKIEINRRQYWIYAYYRDGQNRN